MELKLGREPHRLWASHPLLIQELLQLATTGRQVAVSTMIEMLHDLYTVGRESRFLVKLGRSPLWELKPTSRGGEKGGSRIYLFLLPTGEAGLVNCEVKEPGAPTSQEKLLAALRMMKAYNDGIPVF